MTVREENGVMIVELPDGGGEIKWKKGSKEGNDGTFFIGSCRARNSGRDYECSKDPFFEQEYDRIWKGVC